MQECKGVDLNRNFGYHWGGYGASDNACKETFRGPAAFSEPESRAIRDFLLRGEHNFVLYLTFHSYGQYLLYPWGYDKLDTPDWRELQVTRYCAVIGCCDPILSCDWWQWQEQYKLIVLM